MRRQLSAAYQPRAPGRHLHRLPDHAAANGTALRQSQFPAVHSGWRQHRKPPRHTFRPPLAARRDELDLHRHHRQHCMVRARTHEIARDARRKARTRCEDPKARGRIPNPPDRGSASSCRHHRPSRAHPSLDPRPRDPATLRPTLRPCDPLTQRAACRVLRVFSLFLRLPVFLPIFSCAFDHRRDMYATSSADSSGKTCAASLFRNFLIAQRIAARLASAVSSPPLPPCAPHPLWEQFDLVAEQVCEEYSRRERGGGPPRRRLSSLTS